MNKLTKFEKAYKKLMEHKKQRTELAEAICAYIMVAREDFLYELVDSINKEEEKLEHKES